jgi:hypothetical protein
MRRQANSSLLFASRHFLLAMFPSITSASSRSDELVGGKAEKYGTKVFRYLLLYLPWHSFLFFFPFLYVFIRSIHFTFFLSVSVFLHCFEYVYDSKSTALQAPTDPQGYRRFRLNGFSTICTTLRWQASQLYASAAFTPGVFLVLLRGWVDLRFIVRPEGLS